MHDVRDISIYGEIDMRLSDAVEAETARWAGHAAAGCGAADNRRRRSGLAGVRAFLMGNAGEASGIGVLIVGAAAHAIAGCAGIAGLYVERLPVDKHGQAWLRRRISACISVARWDGAIVMNGEGINDAGSCPSDGARQCDGRSAAVESIQVIAEVVVILNGLRAARLPRIALTRTDLEPEVDRSRCGLRPISARSATDLEAEINRSRPGAGPRSADESVQARA